MDQLRFRQKGKVRDIYELGERHLLMKVSDRVSSFDKHIGIIPGKGELLNKMSEFWFNNKKHIIDNQSAVELEIIMRSIYLQHSPNLPTQIKEQIKYLNELVTNWCVEKIIPEVYQYMGYLKQVEYMPVPIEHPQNLSSKGTRNLRSVTTTF